MWSTISGCHGIVGIFELRGSFVQFVLEHVLTQVAKVIQMEFANFTSRIVDF